MFSRHSILLLVAISLHAASVDIQVDVGRTLNPLLGGHPLGANLCWYFDQEEPAAKALGLAGLRVVRFPFGHRGDNYLWDTPPWPRFPGDPLVPRIASRHEKPALEPGVVRDDGTFVRQMDTDEFARLVRRTGATPIMMVNVLSSKYEGGPSYEQLRESAVEWVRYCNVTCGYGFKYWEIGNEVDLKKSPMTLEEYGPLFRDFSRAMKAVDPTIEVGLGLNTNVEWMRSLLEHVGDEADFLVAHQYNSVARPLIDSYEAYRVSTRRIALGIERAQEAILASTHPRRETLPILVTEFSSYSPAGIYAPDDRQQDLWKSLVTFDLAAELLRIRAVRYATFWSLHDPFAGRDDSSLVGLVSSGEARLLPQGQALALLARHLGSEIVDSTFQVGAVRTLASVDREDRRLRVWLVNRDLAETDATIAVRGARLAQTRDAWVYTGAGPQDEAPTTRQVDAPALAGGNIRTTLPPCSVTLLVLDLERISPVVR